MREAREPVAEERTQVVHGCRRARVVRCWVKSATSATPPHVASRVPGWAPMRGPRRRSSRRRARTTSVIMPLCPGLHTCYNGRYSGMRWREPGADPLKSHGPSSGLGGCSPPHEVGVTSNRGSACRGECVPGALHTARHPPESSAPTAGPAASEGRRRRCGG